MPRAIKKAYHTQPHHMPLDGLFIKEVHHARQVQGDRRRLLQLNEGHVSDPRSTIHVIRRDGGAVGLLGSLVVVIGDELLEPL